MSGVVGAVDRVIRSDRDAVRSHREHTLAPCSDEASIPLVDHHRMLRAAKKKDAILRIDGDRGYVGVGIAGGEVFPAHDRLVSQCRHVAELRPSVARALGSATQRCTSVTNSVWS